MTCTALMLKSTTWTTLISCAHNHGLLFCLIFMRFEEITEHSLSVYDENAKVLHLLLYNIHNEMETTLYSATRQKPPHKEAKFLEYYQQPAEQLHSKDQVVGVEYCQED